jgi:hypothetical protein
MEVTSIVYVYPRTSRRTKRFWPSLGSIAIVTYNLKGLTHNEKVKMIYRLFRKQTKKGMVQQKGGRKLRWMLPDSNGKLGGSTASFKKAQCQIRSEFQSVVGLTWRRQKAFVETIEPSEDALSMEEVVKPFPRACLMLRVQLNLM